MSKQERQLQKTFRKRFAKKQDAALRVPGEMGDGMGNINVPDMEGYVYVRIGGKPVPVYNDQVPNQEGTRVWVGKSFDEKNKFEVISTRGNSPFGDRVGFAGYAPAKRYEWHAIGGGQDPLYVHQRALTFLRLSVSGKEPVTFEVYVNVFGGRIWSGAIWIAVPRQDVDIYTHIPTTPGKAAFVLFTINTSGSVITTKGSEVDIDVLALTDIPSAPANTAFICGAVRVYEGQTRVQEGRTNTDFVDLRFSSIVAMGSGSAIGWDDITDKPVVFAPDTSVTDPLYVRKFLKNAAPTVNDDSTQSYLKTDEWLDQANSVIYKCYDNTAGAAVWLSISGGGSGDMAFRVDGALAVASDVYTMLVTRDMVVDKWYIHCDDPGSAGSTIYDVHLNGTTVFTTQSNRPTLAYDDANGWAVSGTPDVTDFSEGDILTIHIDQVATDAEGLNGVGFVESSGGGGGGSFNLTVEDESATVSVSNVGKIVVPDGSLSDSGGGEVSIAHAPYILLQYQKPNGTEGGAAVANTWTTLPDLVEVLDTGNYCTVASNQFTLNSGTYEIEASHTFYNTNATTLRLYNVTDSIEESLGVTIYTSTAGGNVHLRDRITIGATKTFALQYLVEKAQATYGLGASVKARASNYTGVETYGDIVIRKVG